MFRLILFETKKIFKSTFFRILMVGFLLFFLSYYVFVYINTERAEDEIRNLENSIQRTEQNLLEYRESLESAKGSEARGIENDIEFWENWLDEDKALLELYKKEDWTTILQQEIDDTEPTIGSMRYNNQTHTYTYPTLFTLETYVEMAKWMQEKDVTPLFPVGSYTYITLYDRDFIGNISSEEIKASYEKLSNKYSPTTFHFLDRLFGLVFSVFGAVFFLFLFGDIVTKEGLGRNGSIYLLRTQPIHRDKIIASKLVTIFSLSVLILLGIVILSLLFGIIFDRVGDWEYPVLIYGEDRAFTLMNMGTFLIQSTGIFLMILLFCYSILFLFSIITKRVLITIGLTLGTLLLGTSLSGEIVTSNIAHYIPFFYFPVFEVLTQQFGMEIDNYNFTFTNGMISLGVSTFVILVVTYIVDRKVS